MNEEMRTGWAVYVKDYPVDAIEQQSDGLVEISDAEGICSGRCYDDSIIVATGTTSISEYS